MSRCYQNILQRHLRLGEQRTFSNLEAKEYLIHSGTFEFALIEEFFCTIDTYLLLGS